jgi:hypothetical protein
LIVRVYVTWRVFGYGIYNALQQRDLADVKDDVSLYVLSRDSHAIS